MTAKLQTARQDLLVVEGIEKSFAGVRVLNQVAFSLPAGAALGLVGENGAGKSTLMNILGGQLRADVGTMRFDGADYAPSSPQEAMRRGIAFVHQELNLFPNLTIAENIFLAAFPRVRGTPLINSRESHHRAKELLEEIGLGASPQTAVGDLSAGERQLVEIAKALRGQVRLLIFDEPTTSLSAPECERLFALIGQLRARGIAMIYISHTLPDVFRLSDKIVVLRDGQVAGAGQTSDFTPERLVSLMVGRPLGQLFPPRSAHAGGPTLLDARFLERQTGRDISVTVASGEIVGLAGLMGSGRSELARVLFGLDKRHGVKISLNGETLQRLSPRRSINHGVAFLTENRSSEGLCAEATVGENLALPALPKYSQWPSGWLRLGELRAALKNLRNLVKLDAKTRDDQPARTLSGGNQQKIVLGKWLLRNPRLLILDEPTRGIDVGAKSEIYCLIFDLAAKGAGILVISSEMEELIGLCDRILVMRRGSIVDELKRGEFNRERILRSALGPIA